jgi:hypothetical protein
MGRAEGAGTEPVRALGQPVELEVAFDGATYPAEEISRGAAYELFTDRPLTGFLPNPRPGARWAYRRFVHASEISGVRGGLPADELDVHDDPLMMPVSRVVDWSAVHRMSQSPSQAMSVEPIRRTATVKRGTKMIKFLSPRQLSGHLRGWPLSGFCYRTYDVAHLRTPTDLAILSGDPAAATAEVVFGVRWRAVDAADYTIPFGHGDGDFSGLVGMPPHDRLGPPVTGTGFAPTARHLIPEFVTADLAELPLPANTSLVAYTRDGTEVTLYAYLPEQRAWSRMHGPQWRHLLAEVPGSKEGPFPADQEYFPIPSGLSRYVGQYRGEFYEAIADPPVEFRVAAKTRAARYTVDALARRIPYATWRGVRCTVIRAEGDWLRLRLCRPNGQHVAELGAHCVERGLYEAWAPAAEVIDGHEVDIWYEI